MSDGYRRRVIDTVLDELMPELPAISLDGAKGIGKTATALERAATIFRLDDPIDAERLDAGPRILDTAVPPVLLDEWQRRPEVWDQVRRRVDANAPAGRFLLTGSATPTSTIHSGAGRIVSLRMRPLSLAERTPPAEEISLGGLLAGDAEIDGGSPVELDDYVTEILASGFPGIRLLSPRARRAQLDGYLARITDRDLDELGITVRRPDTLRAWLTAYAAATASTASYTAILDAATPAQNAKPAKQTTAGYRDALTRLWLLDPVPAWTPVHNDFTRLAASPKHFLADPALAARLLDIDEDRLLDGGVGDLIGRRGTTPLGRFFESLVALSLSTYAAANDARLGHFRTANGDREVDFVVHRGRSVVAFEVKVARSIGDDDVRHLHWLREKLGAELRDAAVIYTGDVAYRRRDGIAVIPAAMLSP